MATEKQREAAKENIKNAREKWELMSFTVVLSLRH
jgi:hypothetical protein